MPRLRSTELFVFGTPEDQTHERAARERSGLDAHRADNEPRDRFVYRGGVRVDRLHGVESDVDRSAVASAYEVLVELVRRRVGHRGEKRGNFTTERTE